MTDHSRFDDLADLRARLAAQETRSAAHEATIGTLCGEIVRLRRHRRLPRRFLPVILATLLVALVPLATLAANPFTDLNAGSPHNGNIDAIFTAGITTGCDATSYCPNGNVTREEMASFLARTAGLGANPPVVNARTAQSATNATNVQNAVNAQNATNATTVGGIAPSGLLRVAAVEGGTESVGNALETAAALSITAPAAGFVRVTATVRSRAGGMMMACPCEVRHGLARTTAPAATSTFSRTRHDVPGADTSTALSFVFAATARENIFIVQSQRMVGTAIIDVNVGMTAIFVPFGHDGGPTLAPPPVPR